MFCASADGRSPSFRAAAEELGRGLAQRDIGLIYGGAKVGLMQAVADACLVNGGRVIGVIPHVLVDLEVAHDGLTELHVVDTMHNRKALMGEKADAFIILPGGFGTMEEMFEVLAWQTLKLHDKPVCMANIDGFYNHLLDFLEHADGEGILRGRNREFLAVGNTVAEVFSLLNV